MCVPRHTRAKSGNDFDDLFLSLWILFHRSLPSHLSARIEKLSQPFTRTVLSVIIQQTSERSLEQPFKETKLNYQNSSWGIYRCSQMSKQYLMLLCWCCCCRLHKRWTWWKFHFQAPGRWRPGFDIGKFQQRFFVSPSIKTLRIKETFQCLYFFSRRNVTAKEFFPFQLIALESISHYHHLEHSFFPGRT